jgi:hypothetical protein
MLARYFNSECNPVTFYFSYTFILNWKTSFSKTGCGLVITNRGTLAFFLNRNNLCLLLQVSKSIRGQAKVINKLENR